MIDSLTYQKSTTVAAVYEVQHIDMALYHLLGISLSRLADLTQVHNCLI